MEERLQKLLSRAGVASRREAEKLILEGRVKVNGSVVTQLGAKAVWERDKIQVDGRRIGTQKKVYILLYKPKGVITSVSDDRGRKTVVDLLTDVTQRVYPVGRLDYQTEGVLLLTNDGELTNQLIHPKFKVYKTYIAKLKGIPREDELDKLRIGIQLDDGLTQPAKVRLLEGRLDENTSRVEVTIHEGRNRQVRRMFEAIGYPVKNLKRTKFATLGLDGLRRGEYRDLDADEIWQLKNLDKRQK